MLSRKMVVAIGVFLFFVANIVLLTLSANSPNQKSTPSHFAIPLVASFQEVFTRLGDGLHNIWFRYFYLVSVAEKNSTLKKELSELKSQYSQHRELELSNQRLRELLNFKKTISLQLVAAEVIGKDPSPWYKTVIIDKGVSDSVQKGFPVVIPEGIAGQVVDASHNYSKVLLIIDRNSAVDALVQRTRARGVIEGQTTNYCLFKYVLRKDDVKMEDIVVSSGLDNVFPKGLSIGRVAKVDRPHAGIFQEVTVEPFVDFEKLEEVLVILTSQQKSDFYPK